MNNKFQLRYGSVEIRAMDNQEDSDVMRLCGYVNKTGVPSEELGGSPRFIETIAYGTWQKALTRISQLGRSIDLLLEHDYGKILASFKNGTLKLTEDNIGLYMEAELVDTSYAEDVYKLVKAGILTNMSFGFIVIDDKWEYVSDDLYSRKIFDIDLREVSIVRSAAYGSSDVLARSLETAIDEVPQNVIEQGGNVAMTAEERKLIIDEMITEIRSAFTVVPIEVPAIVEPVIVEPTITEPVVVEPVIVEPIVVEPVVVVEPVAEPVVEPVVVEGRSISEATLELRSRLNKYKS